jgi:hypothetical protein
MNQEIVTKKCNKCQEIKPISEFHKYKRTKDGVKTNCKLCRHLEYFNNKQKYAKTRKLYRLKNKEFKKIYDKEYRLKNIVRLRNNKKLYIRNKRQNNINYKILCVCRKRIWGALKGIKKSQVTEELLGCTISELKLHIEKQFKNDMSWDNYGQFGWHIDHIIPCDIFDLTDPVEQKQCFHYSNLQPLWWLENIKKNNKYLI